MGYYYGADTPRWEYPEDLDSHILGANPHSAFFHLNCLVNDQRY
jgi:hypothetical protein